MSLTVVALALFAALLHAAWNAFLRGGGDRLWTVTIMSVTSSVVAFPFVFVYPLPEPAAWPYIVVSAGLQAGYIFFLISAYRYGELGQVYPVIRGTAPLLVTLGGFLLAGERLDAHQLAGVFLIAAGIMSLALGRGRASSSSILFAVAAGAFIATFSTLDAMGVRLAGHFGSYTAWTVTIYGALLVAAVIAVRGKLVVNPRSPELWSAAGGGVVALLSYGAVVAAFALGPAGPIAALRETNVVFALLIGWLILGEKLTLRRAVACVVVVVGAAFLGYRP